MASEAQAGCAISLRNRRFFECTPEEADAAFLHRFAAAGAANRYRAVHPRGGDIVALDIALPRNCEDWVENAPAIERRSCTSSITAIPVPRFPSGLYRGQGHRLRRWKRRCCRCSTGAAPNIPPSTMSATLYHAKPALAAHYRALAPQHVQPRHRPHPTACRHPHQPPDPFRNPSSHPEPPRKGDVMPTVADQMVETLAAGVRRIWGIVGDSLNGFTDAIRRRGGIDWLHVRHEKSAAFAAGEAEATGNWRSARGLAGRAICTSSTACSMPIAAACRWWRLRHIPSAEIGSGYFQETHPEELFRECSSYCELVSNIAQMPRALEIAIRRAVAERCVSGDRHPGDALRKFRPGQARPAAALLPRAPRRSPPKRSTARRSAQRGQPRHAACAAAARARMTRWWSWPRCSRRRSSTPCAARSISNGTIPIRWG
jgi:hypothetical protein